MLGLQTWSVVWAPVILRPRHDSGRLDWLEHDESGLAEFCGAGPFTCQSSVTSAGEEARGRKMTSKAVDAGSGNDLVRLEESKYSAQQVYQSADRAAAMGLAISLLSVQALVLR